MKVRKCTPDPTGSSVQTCSGRMEPSRGSSPPSAPLFGRLARLRCSESVLWSRCRDNRMPRSVRGVAVTPALMLDAAALPMGYSLANSNVGITLREGEAWPQGSTPCTARALFPERRFAASRANLSRISGAPVSRSNGRPTQPEQTIYQCEVLICPARASHRPTLCQVSRFCWTQKIGWVFSYPG